MADRIIRLFDWSSGYLGRGVNPLAFPQNALSDGENVMLVDQAIACRPGFRTVVNFTGTGVGEVLKIQQVRFPTNNKRYLLAQVLWEQIDVDNGYWLFPIDDALPIGATPIDFTVSEAAALHFLSANRNRVDITTLFDCAVIVSEDIRPLVWRGGLAANGSDWHYPKAVLVMPDGENSYDITSEVTDPDPESYADVGNMSLNGRIVLICPDPKNLAFYFDMNAVNTGVGTDLSVNAGLLFDEATDFSQRDLKSPITGWTQDAGADGHFDAVGANVEEGMTVVLADASENYIVNITPPMTGASSVTLSAAKATQAVTAIYGLMRTTDDKVATSHVTPSADTSILAWTAYDSAMFCAGAGGSLRMVVLGASLSADSQGRLSITFQASGSDPWGNVTINAASIVERDTGANGTTTPTPLLCNGSAGVDIAPGGTATFTTDEYATDRATKNYIVTLDIATKRVTTYRTLQRWETNPDYTAWAAGEAAANAADPQHNNGTYATWAAAQPARNATQGTVVEAYTYQSYLPWVQAGTSYWKEGAATADDQTVTGFSTKTALYGLVEIVADASATSIPTSLIVGQTTDTSAVSLAGSQAIQSVEATVTQPTGTYIWHAVSLDNRVTWIIYKAAAWREIARNNAGTWQYKDALGAWQAATDNSSLGALVQAFAVSDNQITTTQLNAISAGQWATSGYSNLTSTFMNFAWGLDASSSYYTSITQYLVTYTGTGDVLFEGFQNGTWTEGDGWTDNTQVAGVPLAQDGIIEYDSVLADEPWFASTYTSINGVPGFPYRLRVPTSNATKITAIKVQAPCQELSNIGDGQADLCHVILYNETTGETTDCKSLLADNTYTTLSAVVTQLSTTKKLYVGYQSRFNAVDLAPFVANTNAATLVLKYWNGQSWAQIFVVKDGTLLGTTKTFAKNGKLQFEAPAATSWRQNQPISTKFPMQYWVEISTSAQLSATTSLAEVRVAPVPDALVKHRFCETFNDRLVLAGRTARANQVDISAPEREYGFNGPDAGSFPFGGTDRIQAMVAAWDSLFGWDKERAYKMTPSGDSFSITSTEAARYVPVNSDCIVKAPSPGTPDGTRYALYYLNEGGAYVASGLQADSLFNTSRITHLHPPVPWWDVDNTANDYVLDLTNLQECCGVYWPRENWVIWAVPLVAQGQSSTQNTTLLVYDVNLDCWYPPWWIPCSTLALVYNNDDSVSILAGTYDGRIIELFGANTDDDGVAIDWWAETGWLLTDAPTQTLFVKDLKVTGYSPNPVTITTFRNGNYTTAAAIGTRQLSGLTTTDFTTEFRKMAREGDTIMIDVSGSGPAKIHEITLGVEIVRDTAEE